jgi:hypothetical protein
MEPSKKLLQDMLKIENKYIGRIRINDRGLTVLKGDDTLRKLFNDVEGIRPAFDKINGYGQCSNEFELAAMIHFVFLSNILKLRPEWGREIRSDRYYDTYRYRD